MKAWQKKLVKRALGISNKPWQVGIEIGAAEGSELEPFEALKQVHELFKAELKAKHKEIDAILKAKTLNEWRDQNNG